MRGLVRASLGAGVLGLGLVGCGGSAGLSQSQLDAKANAICQNATSEVAAIGQLPGDFQRNAASAAAYLDKVVPISDKATSELEALTPSASVKAAWADFIAKEQAAAKALDSARAKTHNGDPFGLLDFQQATGPLTQPLDAAARAVGATACAN